MSLLERYLQPSEAQIPTVSSSTKRMVFCSGFMALLASGE